MRSLKPPVSEQGSWVRVGIHPRGYELVAARAC
jgi:hypothetical protein